MLSLHSSTSVNKSDGNDDDQSDVTRMMLVDDGDLLAMMLTMNCFGLFRINVTNFFSITTLLKNICITSCYNCFLLADLLPPIQVLETTLIYCCIHQLRQYY